MEGPAAMCSRRSLMLARRWHACLNWDKKHLVRRPQHSAESGHAGSREYQAQARRPQQRGLSTGVRGVAHRQGGGARS